MPTRKTPAEKAKERREAIARKKQEEADKKAAEAEARKEKNAQHKARRSHAAKAAPQVQEVDLNLASCVFTFTKGKGKKTEKGGSIYIGKKANALDQEHLEELKIMRVLNCAKEIDPPAFYKRKRIQCKHLKMEDKSWFDISVFFDDAVDFIRRSIEDEKLNILVHCQEGKSRSTSMVLAYLMKCQRMNLDGAMASVAARRQLVQPNSGFREKLEAFEKACGLEASGAKGDAGDGEEDVMAAKDAKKKATGDAGKADEIEEYDIDM